MAKVSAFLSPCSHKSSRSTKIPEIDSSCIDDNGVIENGEEVSSSKFVSRSEDSSRAEEESVSVKYVQSKSPRVMKIVSPKGLKTSHKKKTAASRTSNLMPKHSAFAFACRERGINVGIRRRNQRVHDGDELRCLGLSLGMSIAAVVMQVLDTKGASTNKISTSQLSMVCVSAVEESIANVFGKRFDSFIQSFEESFDSTLKTFRLIRETSLYEGVTNNGSCTLEEPFNSPVAPDSAVSCSQKTCSCSEGIEETSRSDSIPNQLVLTGEINQQHTYSSLAARGSDYGQCVLGTWEKSVMEQTRSNDLKAVEIALNMQRLRLKESQLDLSFASNYLEKCKLVMGISKASFKEEKLKTQMQDIKFAELIKSCVDCLVAGLLIMSTFLCYGASIYSFELLKEVTGSCSYGPKQSSWWAPNPFGSITALFHLIKCHVVVLSRIVFGLLMILALAYALLQRGASSGQTMPVTFILLLLGVVCGFAGKFCVDTLGASGFWWLLYWEVLCSLHFFANVFTPVLFQILHGPICVRAESEGKVWVPFRFRRVMFYTLLFLVPVLCGLMPFASARDWTDHFVSLLF